MSFSDEAHSPGAAVDLLGYPVEDEVQTLVVAGYGVAGGQEFGENGNVRKFGGFDIA